jgi:hypothetical protein
MDKTYFDQFRNMEPYFEINKEQWSYIKENFEKDDVKEILADILFDYEPPFAEISEDDAKKAFMKLKGIKYHELLIEGEWFPRKAAESDYSLTYEGNQKFFTRNNIGNDASNFFQQHNRWSVDASVSYGPITTWGNKKFITSLMGAAYTLKLEKIDKGELRTMISLRKYICSQFKPNVAKSIYEMYGAETVLDFSMGWGDRLAGFYAADCTKHYVGLDPREENHPIYTDQKEFYEKHLGFFEEGKDTTFIQSPAEDFDYSEYTEYFDIVFTSPPYFSAERYSKDDTQSWIRYKGITEWNEQFLHKALGKIIPTVKKGGIIAINISDIYSNTRWEKGKRWLEICNPMNNFLESQGLTYKGCIGMGMAARPNSGGAGTAKGDHFTEETLKFGQENEGKQLCEPIWIFQK